MIFLLKKYFIRINKMKYLIYFIHDVDIGVKDIQVLSIIKDLFSSSGIEINIS
jgi:hypothetical protein